jgi:hypothetical protein
MASKITFTQQAQDTVTNIGKAMQVAEDLSKTYFDRGYNSGGSNPIIDSDVNQLGITAANVASFITLAQQLINLFGNVSVTQGDYKATLNKMRTDL